MLAGSDLDRAYGPEILTVRGLSYFFTNIKKSEKYFVGAVQRGENLQEIPEVRPAVSTAYHIWGESALHGASSNARWNRMSLERDFLTTALQAPDGTI